MCGFGLEWGLLRSTVSNFYGRWKRTNICVLVDDVDNFDPIPS